MPKRDRDGDSPLSVALVCCGEPKKSMGWFHLTQLLEDSRVKVDAVVEPWFLGKGIDAPGSKAFSAFQQENPAVSFYASIDEMPAKDDDKPLLFLIAGRTCDAPRLFSSAIAKGATHVYLEKPGATSAAELGSMRELAAKNNVEVVVGYNKNVAMYSRNALAVLRVSDKASRPSVTLEHCNEFEPGEGLKEFMRGPGGEGMLHNMSCHELALAATLFGVSTSKITKVVLDKTRSQLLDLGGGKNDWQKVAFTLMMEPPTEAEEAAVHGSGGLAMNELSFFADRCGGNFSRVVLGAADGGSTEYRLPDAELEKEIASKQAADPEMRPYFWQQGRDYAKLKDEFITHIVNGRRGVPEGVVGLEGAMEALRLADFLAPLLRECWASGGEPWVRA